MATEGDVFDTLSAVAAAALFVPVALAVLAVLWGVSFVLALPFGGGVAVAAPTVGTLALALAAVLADTPSGWGARLRIAAYVLAIAAIGIATLAAVWLVVLVPVGLAIGVEIGVQAASGTALLLWAALAVGVLLAIRDTGAAVDWSLTLRMVAAVLLLALLTVGFLAAVWTVVWIVSALVVLLVTAEYGVPFGVAVPATALTAAVLALFVRRELRAVRAVERHADATPIPPEEAPYYYGLTARVAAQLDVPMPTLAYSPRAAPEAMVVGLRPRNVHLVLSAGTVDALDRAELTAVLAHELAHVANRDATVTTAVSLPVVLADGLRAWATGADRRHEPPDDSESDPTWSDLDEAVQYGAGGEDDDEDSALVTAVALALALPTRFFGRAVVAVLSRARESAADRTAAAAMGSPASLASALRTLDERVRSTPARDLREAAPVSSLSILPLDRPDPERPDAAPERGGLSGPLRDWVARLRARLLRSHPPTERRLADLEELLEERS